MILAKKITKITGGTVKETISKQYYKHSGNTYYYYNIDVRCLGEEVTSDCTVVDEKKKDKLVKEMNK